MYGRFERDIIRRSRCNSRIIEECSNLINLLKENEVEERMIESESRLKAEMDKKISKIMKRIEAISEDGKKELENEESDVKGEAGNGE